MKVLVAHSGRQHSHRLARSLYASGLLQAYFTGVPCVPNWIWPLSRLFMSTIQNYPIEVPSAYIVQIPVTPVASRIGMLVGGSTPFYASRIGEQLFDYAVSRSICKLRPRVVVGYENSCKWSFLAAHKIGALKVLDAASVHHSTQDRLYGFKEPDALHEKICRQKDEEIALADLILVTSELALKSYLDAGVDQSRLRVVPMGVEISRFSAKHEFQLDAELRLGFVGGTTVLKGLDLLLEVMRELQFPAVLHVFGKGPLDLQVRQAPNVVAHGWCDQKTLAQKLHENVDVLVQPSRFDSFGMVVLEALACGLPVIVSESVGAASLVEDGITGKVIQAGSREDLAHAIEWMWQNRDLIPLMSSNCVEVACKYDWESYYGSTAELFRKLV